MPLDDDGDDDAPVFGAPLPPDDRLWRHPSELGGTTAGLVADQTMVPKPLHLWGVAVVSGLVGAVLTVGVVAIAGGLNGEVVQPRPGVEKVVAEPTATIAALAGGSATDSGTGVVEVMHKVSPFVARLQVTRSDGTSVGSGVLYRDDGYLVTNAHVIDGALTVEVSLADGTAFDGAVVGRDVWTDVAVVKVDRTALPVATIGSSVRLQVGEQAITVGAPLDGAGPSVTVGVISARGRRVVSASGLTLHDMLATDKPIASESSGGALVDRTGAVIGIATSVADGDLSTMGYATPIEVATGVADEIIATGKAHHVWLGVEGDDLSSGRARDLKVSGGVLVNKVAPGSPAEAAGLKGGDVITALDGAPVTSMSSLVIGLRAHVPGDAVAIEYVRGADHGTCNASLSEKDNP